MSERHYIIGSRTTTIDDETGTVRVTLHELDDFPTAAQDGLAAGGDPTGTGRAGRTLLVPVGIISALLLLAVAAAVGWLAHGSVAAAAGLRGSFLLSAPAGTVEGCAPQPAIADIVAGAPVVVADENGVTIRSTTLGSGVVVDGGRGCQFPFEIDAIGAHAEIAVTVGHQSALRFTAQQLDELHGIIVLRLGAPANAGR
jgi:hypothetical protein